ncbi:MAG: GNAT family N-acetyltransferase [Anaerolinea sp.]|nr:GNAT family N-acetyltransferase [Anaerolinea sp.]
MMIPRTISMTEYDRVIEVLATAFENDPLWQYLVPDLARRRIVIRKFFRVGFRLSVAAGQAYGVGEPLTGVAVWSLPQRQRANPLIVLNGDLLALIFSSGVGAIAKAAPIFSQFDRLHTTYAPEQPQYYLNSIGVLPEAQGKGLASQLIKPFLEQADKEGLSAYTETMTPSNVPIYEHYGFKVMEEYRVPQTDLAIWSLYRARCIT